MENMVKHRFFQYKGIKYSINDYYVVIDGNTYEIVYLYCYFDRIICRSQYSVELKDASGNTKQLNGITSVEFENMIECIEPIPFSLNKTSDIDYENPDAMSVGSGTLWYIIIMLVGSIFNGRILIWIFATVVFFSWLAKKTKLRK